MPPDSGCAYCAYFTPEISDTMSVVPGVQHDGHRPWSDTFSQTILPPSVLRAEQVGHCFVETILLRWNDIVALKRHYCVETTLLR